MSRNKKRTKKTVLILGARGMLGNALYLYLKQNKDLRVFGTDHKNPTKNIFILDAVKLTEDNFNKLIKSIKPNFVVNCIGVIRPGSTAEESTRCIAVNSVFPQRLALFCSANKIRLIHFSTDCVFDGQKGKYKEADTPNEHTIYGISKFLGEIRVTPHVTIRTSIVGKELNSSRNLLNWFLDTKNQSVNGFSKVLWNGVTTLTMAEVVEKIILRNLRFEPALIQIVSPTVSKYELLNIFKRIYKKDVNITNDRRTKSDKTLVKSVYQDKYFAATVKPLLTQVKNLKSFYENPQIIEDLNEII